MHSDLTALDEAPRARRPGRSLGRALTLLLHRPTTWVVLLVLTQIVLWGALSARFNLAPPADSLEQVLLSQELRLEYGKHPPLPTWILYGVNQLVGASIGATFVLGALCSATTLLLLYAWARPLIGARRAAVVTLLVSTIEYLNAGTAYFNHNTVQLPLAMLTIILFHRALTRMRHVDWMLLGVAAGLMMLAKFSAVVLFVAFAFYLLRTGRLRDGPTLRGSMLAAAVCAAVLAPYLIAVQGDSWAPNRYALEAVYPPEVDRVGCLISVWKFTTSQFAKVAPAVLIFLLLRRRAPAVPATRGSGGDRVALGPFLACVGFGPLVLTIVVATATGARLLVGWGTTFHLLLTFWLVAAAPFAIAVPRSVLRRAALLCIGTQAVLWCVVILNGGLPNLHRLSPHRSAPPPPELAEAIQRVWAEHSTAPLTYVVTDHRIGASLAVQYRGHPRVVDGTRPEFSKNVPSQALAACGAVIVVRRLPANDPRASRQQPLEALLDPAALSVVELPARDGSRRSFVIGVRPPANDGGCAAAR